jgi:hypothetical protein
MSDIGSRLYQIVQGSASSGECCLKVLTDLTDLGTHVALANNIALTVAGQLAGNKNGAPPFYYNDMGVEYLTLDHPLGERLGLDILAWHGVSPFGSVASAGQLTGSHHTLTAVISKSFSGAFGMLVAIAPALSGSAVEGDA